MATLTVNATLGNDSVSNAQLENMAQGTIKGRAAGAGTGDPTDLTPDQASTILDAATDPFVRTSNLPSGGGDVVGPASSTDENVPQWDGATGKLLKDGLGVSQGGNGASDANKLVQFKSDGGIEAATGLLAGPAVYGETNALNQPAVQGYSTNGGEGGRFQSVGGDGVSGSSDDGAGLRGTNSGTTNPPLHVNNTDATNSAPLAWIHNVDDEGLEVGNDGGLNWTTATGAGTTRNNVLPDKTGNALKVLRVNGAESDYELVDGVVDGGTLSIGLTFPNAGLKIADLNADHTLVVVPEEMTGDRQLTLDVNDANRTIDLSGNLTVSANATVSGTNTGDQDLSGLMVKASNLSDVSNTGTARDNLGIITRKVSTATTGVGASYTDVTDLSFSVVAGTTYHINVWILAECSNTGGGVCLSANGPAFTYFAARYEGNQTAGSSIIRSDVTAYDSLGSLADPTSVTAANTPYVFQLQAVLVPSANGIFVARVKRSGGSGNVAVRAGMIVAHAM